MTKEERFEEIAAWVKAAQKEIDKTDSFYTINALKIHTFDKIAEIAKGGAE